VTTTTTATEGTTAMTRTLTCSDMRCTNPATHRRIQTDTTTGRRFQLDNLCGKCAAYFRNRDGATSTNNYGGVPCETRIVTIASLRRAYARALATGNARAIEDIELDGRGL
jgi:hypothetical protein